MTRELAEETTSAYSNVPRKGGLHDAGNRHPHRYLRRRTAICPVPDGLGVAAIYEAAMSLRSESTERADQRELDRRGRETLNPDPVHALMLAELSRPGFVPSPPTLADLHGVAHDLVQFFPVDLGRSEGADQVVAAQKLQ